VFINYFLRVCNLRCDLCQFVIITCIDIDDGGDDAQLCTMAWQLTSHVGSCTMLMEQKRAAKSENCRLVEQLIACWSVLPTPDHEL